MAIVSFIDDNSKLGKYYLKRNYAILGELLEKDSDSYTECMLNNDFFIAFDITQNMSLSEIYQDNFFVIRLILSNVSTLHSEDQEKELVKLFENMRHYIDSHPGYYNLRLPSHVVDVIRAYNMVFSHGFFCGGTVELIADSKKADLNENIHVKWADKVFIDRHKNELMNISFESFKEFQGQYHISPVTSDKAGIIYKKWLENSFNNYQGNVIVGFYDNNPMSFALLYENADSVELVLGAVDKNYRNLGGYKQLSAFAMNYATDYNKYFLASTQLDNFYAQRAWLSIGLKPFYSIYNIHLDRREIV